MISTKNTLIIFIHQSIWYQQNSQQTINKQDIV